MINRTFSLLFLVILSFANSFIFGQRDKQDSLISVNLDKVVITSNRLPVLLKNNIGAIALVTPENLSLMPKSIGIEEALRLVPGVRIDNQHDGERVHVSIRGQGILTERGLRGIGVLIDGIPVNDPSGFAPDLYDVDWSTVKKIEVLRSPSAGLYGGGGASGLINITTRDGGLKPLGGELSQSIGSNGFTKSLVQLDGSKDKLDYRMSFSRTNGAGYREHQAFRSNKLYEKINFHPSEKLIITQVISHIDYFQQNPEGLSLSQFDNLLQANPDARPFNEYQKTNRTTIASVGTYKISELQDLQATTFLRIWQYKETSNKCAEYRNYSMPGTSIQYNLHLGTEHVKSHFSIGTDLKWQRIDMYKLQSEAKINRTESIDETSIETDSLLANQLISQKSSGWFALCRLEAGKFNLMGNIRYDRMNNELNDKLLGQDTSKTKKNFSKVSARLGASYSINDNVTAFINWSQGFMPPSTEELASNPVGYHGFNTHLVPAISNCGEIGLRGFYNEKLSCNVTFFKMNTENDFFRFKQSGRGNQEVFYGNAGNSLRYGLEAYISSTILEKLNLQVSYTYSDYKYSSAHIDPVYTDTSYVLTSPPSNGQWLPNSPQHQVYSELAYSIIKNLKLCLGTEFQSKWAIYTDSKAYLNEPDPAIYQNWQKGFNLYNARIEYQWVFKGIKGELSLSARNLTGEKYMAFTEPDPDGNSYQPGPGREFFANIKIRF